MKNAFHASISDSCNYNIENALHSILQNFSMQSQQSKRQA